jgi:carbamoyl-phosphate synthase large subunit
MVNYFKEALAGIGQVHAANSIETYAMHLADVSVITPLIFDESYIGFLLEYSIRNKIRAIIPLFDIDLPILAMHKQEFANNGIEIVVSDYEIIQICNDKWLTYQFLKGNGLNTPITFLSVKKAVLALNNEEIKFPLIVKPRWGVGSIGIFQADNFEELEILYKKTQRIIAGSYLRYESQVAPDENVIIQQKVDGEEIDLDVLNDLDGNYLMGVPVKVLEMRAGESNIIEIINDDTLIKIGQMVSDKLRISGCWNMDTILRDEKYFILEINCRLNGLSPFSYLAGTNFPKAIVKMLQGEKVDDSLLNAKTGTVGIKDIVPVKYVHEW